MSGLTPQFIRSRVLRISKAGLPERARPLPELRDKRLAGSAPQSSWDDHRVGVVLHSVRTPLAPHAYGGNRAPSYPTSVTPDRENELEQQIAKLRSELGILRETVADLQASAIRWRGLYEAAIFRCGELERELKKLSNSPN